MESVAGPSNSRGWGVSTFKDATWQQIIRMTPVQLEAYKDQLQAHTSRIIYGNELHEAAELQKAGWTPEPLYPHSLLMAWRWRRPGKRPGKKGRLFMSTSQAVNALRRSAK